jgi:ribonucleoside-diphosphate reductase beta chain
MTTTTDSIILNAQGVLQYTEENPFAAVNWNEPDDDYTKDIIDTSLSAFWHDQRLIFSDDALDWKNMTDDQRGTYMHVFGGLTLLDTKQSSIGMTTISILAGNEQRRMAFNNFAFMESIHAKMYSSVFTTLLSREQIKDVFAWIKENPYLQKKVSIIEAYYRRALQVYVSNFKFDARSFYLCLACSVMLESFLFYSGFFYPLYLSGQKTMRASGEGIGLICRDEAIHGLYTGAVAQEVFELIPEEEQQDVLDEVMRIFTVLMDNEVEYTTDLYTKLGLVDEVVTFLKYNANLAFQNLGLEDPYPEITENSVNPVVLNGLSQATVQQDFFSGGAGGIGNGYSIAMNVSPVTDEHFKFNKVDEFAEYEKSFKPDPEADEALRTLNALLPDA